MTVSQVWDDHEVADNTYKDGSADSNNTKAGYVNGIPFSERKRNAVKAYYEWMPIRQVDTTDKLRIYRQFQYGKLADINMADTRYISPSLLPLLPPMSGLSEAQLTPQAGRPRHHRHLLQHGLREEHQQRLEPSHDEQQAA